MTNIIPIKCCLIPSPTPSKSALVDICIRGLVYQNSSHNIKNVSELGNIVAVLNYKELNFISRPYTINLPGVPTTLDNNFQINFSGQLYIDNADSYKLNLVTNLNAQYSITIDNIIYNNNTNIYLNPGLHSISIQYVPGNSDDIELKMFWNSVYTNNTDVIIPYSNWYCSDPLASPTPTPTPMPPSATPTNTPTPSITPTNTLTPSVTPTIGATPSVTPSVSITASITPSVSITPSLSPSRAVPIQSDPTLLTQVGGQNHIVFSWAAPANPITTPQEYHVQINNTTIGILSYNSFPVTGSNVIRSGIITGLQNYNSYDIRIAAYYPSTHVFGNLVYGNTISSIPVPNIPVGAASQILSTKPGFSAIEIEWADPTWDYHSFNANFNTNFFRAIPASYDIYYSTDSGLSWTLAGSTDWSFRKIIISNLNSSLNYIFRLVTHYSIWGFNYGTAAINAGEHQSIVFTNDYATPTKPL
jgi:hypothetical protein